MSINSLAVEAVRNRSIPKPPSQADVLAALTKYIPIESITLYVATVTSQTALASVFPHLTPRFEYWLFLALTPVLMLVLFLRILAVAGKPWNLPVSQWPWWRMIAATVAFGVWALAIPGNPFIPADNASAGVLAGLAALFVSTILNMLQPFVEHGT